MEKMSILIHSGRQHMVGCEVMMSTHMTPAKDMRSETMLKPRNAPKMAA